MDVKQRIARMGVDTLLKMVCGLNMLMHSLSFSGIFAQVFLCMNSKVKCYWSHTTMCNETLFAYTDKEI